MDAAGIAPDARGGDPYADAAADWAAGARAVPRRHDAEEAARGCTTSRSPSRSAARRPRPACSADFEVAAEGLTGTASAT